MFENEILAIKENKQIHRNINLVKNKPFVLSGLILSSHLNYFIALKIN